MTPAKPPTSPALTRMEPAPPHPAVRDAAAPVILRYSGRRGRLIVGDN